jgi:hypothetical protein
LVSSSESQKRPQVRCDNEKLARIVVQQVPILSTSISAGKK